MKQCLSQLCHLNYVPPLSYLHSLPVRLHAGAPCALSLLPSIFFPPLPECRLQFKAPFQLPGLTALQPANKSSTNLHPESLCPCTDCSSLPLLGNATDGGGAGRASASEPGREDG